MTPSAGGQPEGKVMEAIKSAFGDFATFKTKFKESAMGRFGSGWVWLITEDGKIAIVSTPNQDTPVMEKKKVILGLDVWEHAYYLKYKNMRADYVEAWWNIVNWRKVGEIYHE